MTMWEKIRIALCVGLGLVGFASAAHAQTQAILPNGMTQFSDGNGAPYAGGRVYMYVPSTTTPKATYQDPNAKVPNQNPVTLDANGRGIMWGSGEYRQVLQDSNGSVVWDQLTLAPGTSSNGGSTVLWYGTSVGTANAITLIGPTGFNGTDGQIVGFLANATNTTTATINAGGFGSILVQKNTPIAGLAPLSGGEIVSGALEIAVYSATSNSFNLIATNVTVNPTVYADPTSLTEYNTTVPYTSTTTFGGIFDTLGASKSLRVLPSYTQNAMVAMSVQTNTATLTNPTAVSAVGVLNAAGAYAYGLFGYCYQFTTGGCNSGQFNTYNESANATNAFPPVGGFPDTATEPVGVQIAAYGGFMSKVGLWIAGGVSNNGTGNYGYAFGEYIGVAAAYYYGILVDATSTSSPIIDAQFNTSGTASEIGVKVNSLAAPGSGFLFFTANEPSLGSVFTVGYLGSVVSNGNLTLGTAAGTVSAGQVGYGSSVAASSNCGSLSGATGCLVVNIAGTARYVPYY